MRMGTPSVPALRGHRLDVLGLADVARIQPQALDSGIQRGQRHAVLVVDVGHDRHGRAGNDLGQPLRGLDLVAGTAHDVGTGCG